jgi:hypothetical protein
MAPLVASPPAAPDGRGRFAGYHRPPLARNQEQRVAPGEPA